MTRDDRKHERIPTILEVRFGVAADFVTEYAENLSAGGLFVRGAQDLEPMTILDVQIDLPGFERFQVKAKVAHLMDEETATRFKRSPGAGLQLVEVPAGFEDALMSYLGRLGRRRDGLVLVEEEYCESVLSNAGFRTERAQLASVLEATLSSQGLLAVVVSKPTASMFRELLAGSPKNVQVIGCDCRQEEEPLLVELDRMLAAP